jgi:hypothetical protein
MEDCLDIKGVDRFNRPLNSFLSFNFYVFSGIVYGDGSIGGWLVARVLIGGINIRDYLQMDHMNMNIFAIGSL